MIPWHSTPPPTDQPDPRRPQAVGHRGHRAIDRLNDMLILAIIAMAAFGCVLARCAA